MVKAAQVVSFLEKIAPPELAEAWDNSGLQVGSQSQEVSGILLALDADMAALDAAEELGVEMVITHHPLIFKGLKNLDPRRSPGSLIRRALILDKIIYCLHTNLDSVQGGVSDCLASTLGLTEVKVLNGNRGQYYKLAVFVPQTHLEVVRKALGEAGAGDISGYSYCSFAALGEGIFIPGKDCNPFFGQKGELTRVAEYRLETLIKPGDLAKVLAAMSTVHPYEEVAYDLVRLENPGDSGMGRIGRLAQPMKLKHFARHVGKKLGSPGLRVTGNMEKELTKVAVMGGSGGDIVQDAWQKGADCLVTGDVKYHQARQALELGLALVDPGHFHSEIGVLEFLRRSLAGHFGQDLNIHIDSRGLDADPFQWIVDS